MNCPLCNKLLQENDGTFICPAGHGSLISGKLLGELKRLNIPDETPIAQTQANAKQTLLCPNCGAQMQKVNYNDTGIVIDACTQCPYRWLNAGEIKKIEEFKPNVQPEDLLFLEGLKEKAEAISASAGAEDTENPEVPLYSGGLGGLIRGGMAGNDTKTLGWITGAAMYGLITGIIKSKVVRVIAPFVIVGFIVLFYLIFKEVKVITQGK